MKVLSGVLAQLLCFPAFVKHAGLLLGDDQLCRTLLVMLLPGIHAMANWLQLPPERRSSEFSWHSTAHTAHIVAVMVHMLPPVLAAAPGGATQLLQAAVQLLQHCPLPATAAGDGVGAVLGSSLCFVCLLGAAAAAALQCRASGQQQQQQQPTRAAAVDSADQAVVPQPLTQLLLAVLPRVGEALASAAQLPRTSLPQFARVARAAHDLVCLLRRAAEPQPADQPAAALAAIGDLPAWLHGAAAALRWLPATAALAVRPQLELPERYTSTIAMVMQHATLMASDVMRLAQGSAATALHASGRQAKLPVAWLLYSQRSNLSA